MVKNSDNFCIAFDAAKNTVKRSPFNNKEALLREDYLRQAQKVIPDPNILINVVSRRVKQLKYGARPTVESLEKLSLEDIALLEIIKGHIKYELYEAPKESEDL